MPAMKVSAPRSVLQRLPLGKPGLVTVIGCLLIGLGLPRFALAAPFCFFERGGPETVHVQPGGKDVNLTGTLTQGQVLWTSGDFNPVPNTTRITCANGTSQSGIHNTIGGPPVGGDDTLFPTNIPGISYKITHSSDFQDAMHVYPHSTVFSGPDGGKTSILSVPTGIQLIYTGPDMRPSNGSQMTVAGKLTEWQVDMCDKPKKVRYGSFGWRTRWQCNGTIKPTTIETVYIGDIIFKAPTCNVVSTNKTVTLPTVSTGAFIGRGTTTGNRNFMLKLDHCHDGLDVYISLGTNSTTAYPGVVAASGGDATGVGVQVLYSDNTPVQFNRPFSQAHKEGSTSGSDSVFTIPLKARYYQTGNSVTAGSLSATATYTISYK